MLQLIYFFLLNFLGPSSPFLVFRSIIVIMVSHLPLIIVFSVFLVVYEIIIEIAVSSFPE